LSSLKENYYTESINSLQLHIPRTSSIQVGIWKYTPHTEYNFMEFYFMNDNSHARALPSFFFFFFFFFCRILLWFTE